jgi:hypothetical protein
MIAISSVSNDRSVQAADLWDCDAVDQDDVSQTTSIPEAPPISQFSLANFVSDNPLHPIVHGLDSCSSSSQGGDARRALLEEAQQMQTENEDLGAQAQSSGASQKSNLLSTLLGDLLNMIDSTGMDAAQDGAQDPTQDALQDTTQDTAQDLQ